MELFGLDIGSSSIKLVQLEKEKDTLVLKAVGEAVSPQPGMEGETEAHLTETATAIKKLLADLKIKTKNVVLGIPEPKVISRLIWFPSMKESELQAALEFEAETFIPYPRGKVQLDYKIIDKDKDGRLLVFVIACLNQIIEKYLKTAKLADITPVALESPAVSLCRVFAANGSANLIMDIGAKYTVLTVGKSGNVFLTRTLPLGTESFLRAISISLGIEVNAAEGYRRAYGLGENELEGKVRKAMMPLFEKLVEEIKKAIFSFKEEWQNEVGLITLCGGGATTPGFTEQMAKILGVEVQLAQPFAKTKIISPLPFEPNKEGARFAVVFGLAARDLI